MKLLKVLVDLTLSFEGLVCALLPLRETFADRHLLKVFLNSYKNNLVFFCRSCSH